MARSSKRKTNGNTLQRSQFGYVRKRSARKGGYAMIAFAAAFAITAAIFAVSFLNGSDAAPVIGAFGIIAAGIAGYGIWLAVESFHEIDRTYGLSRAAIVLNALVIALYVGLFAAGLKG